MYRKGSYLTQEGNEKFGRKKSRLGTTLEVRRGRTDSLPSTSKSVAPRMSRKRTKILEEVQTSNPETSIKKVSA
jgi:hypothetical protein